MSKFYGTLKGSRGEATRCGTANSGLTTTAASFAGAIQVNVWEDKMGVEKFSVSMVPWCGEGSNFNLVTGILGSTKELHVCGKEDQNEQNLSFSLVRKS